MTHFTQKYFRFPDPRSAQELAKAIWNYELLPERDFTNAQGDCIHSRAKTFASISLDESDQVVAEFRRALFVLSGNDNGTAMRRGVENALTALENLAKIYDNHASEFRRLAEVEFINTPNGPVGRHNAEMAADINDAENSANIARKLRGDQELHNLVQALADKLQITLTTKERER